MYEREAYRQLRDARLTFNPLSSFQEELHTLIVYLCEPVCKYLDLLLKSIVELLPSHARDTGNVIQKVENLFLEPDMWLITYDVEALYTSIAHQVGLEATRAFLVVNFTPSEEIDFIFA